MLATNDIISCKHQTCKMNQEIFFF
ncbi:hypothetical protein ATH33_0201 [Thermoactinomyces vulgaris]|nr:hypothetical protein ATH33_0201 [Thermoactinomyces vulgaris]